MSGYREEQRGTEVSDLMMGRLVERRRTHLCLDVRSPHYNGPDADDDEDDNRIHAFAEGHRAMQLAHRLSKDQIAQLVVESLRVMLAAYDAEDGVPQEQLDQVRINLAAWDLVKDKP